MLSKITSLTLILSLVSLPATALAGPCDDIGAILAAGLGEGAAVESIQRLQPTFSPEDYACLEAQGAPPAVLRAAAPLVRTPAPAPQAPAAPAARPAPAMGPPPPPAQPTGLDPRLLRAELLRMEAAVPDSGVAVGLAATLAFGSGHFYAGNNAAGAAFMGTDALALGLILGSAQGAQPKPGALAAGALIGGLSRMLQPATAGLSAKRRRVEWLEGEPVGR